MTKLSPKFIEKRTSIEELAIAAAKAAAKVEPFSGKYHTNSQRPRKPGEDACAHCGRPVKVDACRSFVHVHDGGAAYVLAADADKEVEGAGDMGWWAVGSDCAKKLRAAGVLILESLDR